MGSPQDLIYGRHNLLAVQSELTYGLDPFGGSPPSAYLASKACEIVPQINVIEIDREKGTHSGTPHETEGSHNTVSFELPLTGSAAAGTPPAFAAILKACNLQETIVAATSVSYSPVTTNSMALTPSATFRQYLLHMESSLARLQLARGFKGNLTFNLTRGQEAIVTGEGPALFDAYPASTIAAPTLPTAYSGNDAPMIVRSLAIKLNDGADFLVPVESIELSLNWDVTEVRAGSGEGLSRVFLTRAAGSRIGGSMILVDGSTALNKVLSASRTGEAMTLEAVVQNATSVWTLTAPVLQFGSPTKDKQQVSKFPVPFFLNGSGAGNNDFNLTLTAA